MYVSTLNVTASRLCALAMVVVLSGNIPARGSGDQTPSEPETKIVADTEEASFDLVVRDSRGRPVTNLKASDLRVLDAGTPVKLSYISPVTLR
ncbi:MAG: hypothetical protein JO061_15050, partial [Acidobacteriaceae bacterium]|nr:hypothetical protein [Acidobacteriaceae bacterium]